MTVFFIQLKFYLVKLNVGHFFFYLNDGNVGLIDFTGL